MAKKKKTKSAKRSAAGKKRWREMSAAAKGKVLAALRRGRGSSKSPTAQAPTKSKGKTKMARKGGQGIVSWITSFIALLIGLFPVWTELSRLTQIGTFPSVVENLNSYYNPLSGSPNLKTGYGALVGGIIFKVVSSELTKRAQIRSIIPALHG